eukprot:TRINITY_DN2381_c0_g1_i2.p1 TRINITY_DN2381_c0_g1~~TRINITY_DN2381_c0_g1_i2.p1  ORF type:complete len:200 (+),score=29.65 TRINITY_DN2381_c0_g1_i2:359-958(+)
MAATAPAAASLPLTALNHISLVCRSIDESMDFYEDVLGFVPVKRPGSFDFDGAWLFNYGIGIHLLQSEDPDAMPHKTEINPKDCHISFQCESMQLVEKRLQELKIKYVKRTVEEGGVHVDQIFIHDPDGFMIEMCNCENLPVIPLVSPAWIRCPKPVDITMPSQQQQQQQPLMSSLTCKTWLPTNTNSSSNTQGLTYGV